MEISGLKVSIISHWHAYAIVVTSILTFGKFFNNFSKPQFLHPENRSKNSYIIDEYQP